MGWEIGGSRREIAKGPKHQTKTRSKPSSIWETEKDILWTYTSTRHLHLLLTWGKIFLLFFFLKFHVLEGWIAALWLISHYSHHNFDFQQCVRYNSFPCEGTNELFCDFLVKWFCLEEMFKAWKLEWDFWGRKCSVGKYYDVYSQIDPNGWQRKVAQEHVGWEIERYGDSL